MNSRCKPLVASLMALAVLGACGGVTRRASGPAHGSTPAAPVHVGLDVSGERVTSKRVGPAGATLVAVGRDGTRYSLAVPRGALASKVRIRVVPIRTITGLPGATQLAFGVDLAPHGLVFQRAAWLTVAPHDAAGVKAGLAIADTGVASLQPIGRNAHGFVLPVAHFSGTGGVRLPGGFDPWPNRQPGGVAGAIQSGAIGAGGPITVPPTFPNPPSPPAADPTPAPGAGADPTGANGGSDPSLEHDLGDYLQQLADEQLMGTDGHDLDATRAALVGRMERVIDDLATQCVKGMDPTKITDILRWQQRAMLLGIDDDPAEAARQEAIVRACTRFELVVSGKLFLDTPPVFHIGDAIDLTIPMELDGVGHTGTGSAAIQPTGYDRGSELLDVFTQGLGMAAGVNVPNNLTQNDYVHCTTDPGSIRGDAAATGMYDAAGPKVALSFTTTRQTSVTCDGGVGTFQVPPFVTMTGELQGLGVDEATAGGFVLTKFRRSGAAKPYAHEEIHKELSMGGGSIKADWTFTVNFAPGTLPPPAPRH